MDEAACSTRSVVLLRHTRLAQAEGVCYGRSELALAATADLDIAGAIEHLPPFDLIISSPAERCRRLALAARASRSKRSVALRFDARWLELDFGSWEGSRWDELPRAELDAWAADSWNYVPGGGESAAALYARIEAALRDMRRDRPVGRTLVVSHAGPLRAAQVLLRGLSFAQHFDIEAAPGAWVELPLTND